MWTLGRVLKLPSLLIVCCIFFSQLSTVSAMEPKYLDDLELNSFGFTNYEKINPNLLIYPLKRVSEEIKLNLTFNREQKKEYIYNLYEIRLKELVYIINNKKEGFLFFTADRYNSFVGKIKKEYPLKANSKTKFQDRIKLLERLRDIYPANSQYWDKLQQTIATTKSLI